MTEEKEKLAAPAENPPAGKSQDIVVTSQFIGEGENRRPIPRIVKVRTEKDMTPELILEGTKMVQHGAMNCYTTRDGKHARFHSKTGVLVSLLLAAFLSLLAFAVPASAQYGVGRTRLKVAATEAPYVTLSGITTSTGTAYAPATLLKVNYTAGKVYLGDTAVAVTGGQLTSLTASKATCTAPAFSACDIVYANSSGTVAFSTNPLVAFAAGNSVLAFVQTSSTAVTEIRYPWETTLNSPYILLTATTGAITPTITSAAIQTVGQAQTVAGIVSGDKVALISQPAPTSLCPATSVIASGTDTLTIYFTVLTAAGCTPAAGTYIVSVMR